jgi:hypothetical protein
MVQTSGLHGSTCNTRTSPTQTRTPPTQTTFESYAYSATIALLCTFGVVVRCWQYLGKDSYFLDEIALLRNLEDRSWITLLSTPLAYSQVAPPGFLILQKLMASLFGVSEYSLRFFPFVFSVGAIFAFGYLTSKLLSRTGAITSLCMFVTAGPLILFAAQLKPYSGDVLCTCVLLLAATKYLQDQRPQHARTFGLLAAVLVWFSQPAVIVAGSIGIVLVGNELIKRREARTHSSQPAGILALAVFSAIASTWHALHSVTRDTRVYLRNFWDAGFAHHRLSTTTGDLWPYGQLHNFYGLRGLGVLAYRRPGAFVLATILGMLLLPTKRKTLGWIVVAPILLALVGSAAGQYPLSDRLILYLIPAFFIAVVFAAETVAVALTREWQPAVGVVLALLAVWTAYPVLRTPPTYHLQQVRVLSQFVASRRARGSPLYVYYGVIPEFSYYGPRYGLIDEGVIPGACHRGDTRGYFQEIDQMRGQKDAWILVGNSLPMYHEREDIIRYLDAIGVRRSNNILEPRTYGFYVPPVGALNYDLSDVGRYENVSASNFPVSGPTGENPGRPCGFGPDSMKLLPVR